jgi:hypothetical protein
MPKAGRFTEGRSAMPFLYPIILLLSGGIAGLGAGFMGIGGGAVLTPVCMIVYPLLGVSGDDLVKIIFGTNMFLVTVLSVSAAVRHNRNNRVDWRTVLAMGPTAVLGSVLGSWAASAADPLVLKKGFALLLIVSSTLIIVRGSPGPSGPHGSGAALSRSFLPLLGVLTGFLGSFLGIGGGIVMIPALILIFAIPVTVVAGTSSSIIVCIGVAATLSYMGYGQAAHLDLPGWSTGYVWWSAAIPLMLGGVPMAALGARLNARTRAKVLQRIFGAVLLVLAIRILFM